jgi:hypothetical protein
MNSSDVIPLHMQQEFHAHPIGMRLVSGVFVLLATFFLMLCVAAGLGICVIFAIVLRRRYQEDKVRLQD